MNQLAPTQKKLLDLCISQLEGLYNSNDIKSPSIGSEWESEYKSLSDEIGIDLSELDNIMWQLLIQIRDLHGK